METNHLSFKPLEEETLFTILEKFNLPPSPLSLAQLSGGANNQVYKLKFSNAESVILKRYFHHPKDPRSRLHSEFSFSQYLWDSKIRCIPKPLLQDPASHTALYSFEEGEVPKTASRDFLSQICNFFLALNQNQQKAAHLPVASEGCFSLESHIKTIETRISRLLEICPKTSLEKKCGQFLHSKLLPMWNSAKESALCQRNSFFSQRCLSPSDFGLHNALLQNQKTLLFLDFEYAGWDDLTKTICDLFLQPKIPFATSELPYVIDEFSSLASEPCCLKTNVNILFPLLTVKWCCILLNLFSPVGKARRNFASSEEVAEQQLNKAQMLLEKFSKKELFN